MAAIDDGGIDEYSPKLIACVGSMDWRLFMTLGCLECLLLYDDGFKVEPGLELLFENFIRLLGLHGRGIIYFIAIRGGYW